MPKLRNGGSDLEKLTQWFGRKCRNHNPLEELNLPKANTRPNVYKAKTKGDLAVVAEQPNILLYTAGNRTFEIAINEVGPEKYDGQELKAVGH